MLGDFGLLVVHMLGNWVDESSWIAQNSFFFFLRLKHFCYVGK